PEAHLMAGQIWAIGEIADGEPTKLTLELATAARQLAEKSGGEARTVLVGAGASGAATAAAAYGPAVIAVEADTNGKPLSAVVATRVAALVAERKPDFLLIGASLDGKDIAGMLLGLTDLPLLANGAG